jgi:hypothetical protein
VLLADKLPAHKVNTTSHEHRIPAAVVLHQWRIFTIDRERECRGRARATAAAEGGGWGGGCGGSEGPTAGGPGPIHPRSMTSMRLREGSLVLRMAMLPEQGQLISSSDPEDAMLSTAQQNYITTCNNEQKPGLRRHIVTPSAKSRLRLVTNYTARHDALCQARGRKACFCGCFAESPCGLLCSGGALPPPPRENLLNSCESAHDRAAGQKRLLCWCCEEAPCSGQRMPRLRPHSF